MAIEWFNEDERFADHDGGEHAEENETQPGGVPGVDW